MEDIDVEFIKDIGQLSFWVIAAFVAVLTYRQARRTFLQPMRTEVFKAQLKVMSEIMALFVGKGEIPLRGDFGFNKLFIVNAIDLYDQYADNFFDETFDVKDRPYNLGDCPERIGIHPEVKAGSLTDSPAVRQARWEKYQHDHLHINRQYVEMKKQLTELLSSPLLPLDVVNLLTGYLAQAGENLEVLMRTLEDFAGEMPGNFPSFQSLADEGYPHSLQHEYMANFKYLEPAAQEIIEFIRSYFDVENLTEA